MNMRLNRISSHPIRLMLVLITACMLGHPRQSRGQAPLESSQQVIRVLTYNIHHGQGIDGKLDLPRIADVIQSTQPDIVTLQEVDQNVARSDTVDQPAALAKLTGMTVAFGPNLKILGGQYGNAILSKFPILSDCNLALPSRDNGEQRGVLMAQVRWGRTPLLILATHLDHRRDDRQRMESAQTINQWILDMPSNPAILAGDINATRDSPVLEKLTKKWAIAGETEQPTIPVASPNRQIDFVLTYPRTAWNVVQTQVIDAPVASDHRPLLAVLQLSESDNDSGAVAYDDVLLVPSESAPAQTATTPDQWHPRRETIRQSMQSVMGWLPVLSKREPPTVNIIEEADCGSYVRQKITFQSQPNGQTPAYLCIPKGIQPSMQVPAVLCLHPTDDQIGHGVIVGLGGKPNRQYAAELAKRGYVTLSPSYPLLANYQPDLQSLGWESGTLKAIWDNIRGIDLLQSMPQVDSEAIGAIGHSLGGHNSIYTAVFDPRIKVIVSSCGFDSFADYYDGNPEVWAPGKGWTQLRYMPRMANYQGRLNQVPFDFDELLAALAPRHVLVVAPLHDSNFRSASVDRMTDEARKVFQLYGQPDRLKVIHPDCDHDFPDEMREEAYRMFDRVLKR